QCNEFRSRSLLTGKSDRQTSTEGLQMLQEEFRVAAAAAEAHAGQGAVEQVPYLLQIAGRGDELQTTEIFSFGNTVDDVSFIDVAVITWGIEIFNACIAVECDDPVAQAVQLAQSIGLFRRDLSPKNRHARVLLQVTHHATSNGL